MSEQQDKSAEQAAADRDDGVDEQIAVTIDGEEIVIDRAKVAALAERIAASPDGDRAGALFTFMASLPGADLAAEREIGPKGPGPRPDADWEEGS